MLIVVDAWHGAWACERPALAWPLSRWPPQWSLAWVDKRSAWHEQYATELALPS
jgi:hypothetical protein